MSCITEASDMLAASAVSRIICEAVPAWLDDLGLEKTKFDPPGTSEVT
jgi:hypothetical protein